MCAVPRHSAAPSRLTTAFGSQLACLVAWGMHDCSMEDLRNWQGQRYIAVPAEDARWAEEAVAGRAEVLIQTAGSFGQRLIELDAQLVARGVVSRIFLGAYAPALNTVCLQAASQALDRGASVIGATPDGRPALLGTSRGWPALDRLHLDRVTAAGRIASCCRNAGYELAFVNPGVTIGCAADIEPCRREIESDLRPARARLQFLLSALGTGRAGGRPQITDAIRGRCDTETTEMRVSA